MVRRYDTDRDGDEYETESGPFVHYTDYAALAAELAETQQCWDNDEQAWIPRICELEAALREATWLLHEDVPGEPPVTEDEHYARKAAWNVELARLGIPTNCYAPETLGKP